MHPRLVRLDERINPTSPHVPAITAVNSFSSAIPAPLDTEVDGALASIAEIDYYRVTAPANGSIGVTVTPRNSSVLDPKVTIYDATLYPLCTVIASPGTGAVATMTGGVVAGQTYYVSVDGATEDVAGVGEYQMRATFTPSLLSVTGVQFGDGSDQRSMVRQVVINFSNPVKFSTPVGDAFTLFRTSGGVTGNVGYTATLVGNAVILNNFHGDVAQFDSLADGYWGLRIDASRVVGSGAALDGIYDSSVGGDYVVLGNNSNRFFRLYGDVTGDAKVDQADFAAFRGAFRISSSVFDFDMSGRVMQDDFAAFRQRFHTSL